ncbi:MAG: hypothetical protein JRI97_11535 [Deltaproteobacteria bacterium]|nr:hypothetical protein [Deltaproteobacteria bacterium]
MSLHDLPEFLRLSGALMYVLSARTGGWDYVILHITDRRSLEPGEKKVLTEALRLLLDAYGDRRRISGPPSVLHPLRATGLLSRALDRFELLDILAAMFHDTFEDIFPFHLEDPGWKQTMYHDFTSMLGPLDQRSATTMYERVLSLTLREGESYYSYVGRLIDHPDARGLLRVKLADRLDNTLDMRVDFQEPWVDADFYPWIFRILFSKNPPPGLAEHPPRPSLNGAQRLHQLFKNVTLLSLLRQKGYAGRQAFSSLFEALALASLKESQRIFLHLAGFHRDSLDGLRDHVKSAMEYTHAGGVDRVTSPGGSHPLDGLFSTYFDHTDKTLRKERLKELYADKALMLQASLAFAVIFSHFHKDPSFHVRGITSQGVHPHEQG